MRTARQQERLLLSGPSVLSFPRISEGPGGGFSSAWQGVGEGFHQHGKGGRGGQDAGTVCEQRTVHRP